MTLLEILLIKYAIVLTGVCVVLSRKVYSSRDPNALSPMERRVYASFVANGVHTKMSLRNWMLTEDYRTKMPQVDLAVATLSGRGLLVASVQEFEGQNVQVIRPVQDTEAVMLEPK
jgi:hypothetical protein